MACYCRAQGVCFSLGLFIFLSLSCGPCDASPLPIVINTWAFTDATAAAWELLSSDGSALNAVLQGCSTCEDEQCDGTVGFGGSPDEDGETALDALIMDGSTMAVGAVSSLRHVKQAIRTAHAVMRYTSHTLLTGLQATTFAMEMGLPLASLTTRASAKMHADWVANNCEPNFRMNVKPDPGCGPYQPVEAAQQQHASSLDNVRKNLQRSWVSHTNHDTIAMVAIDAAGNIAVGCSSNGSKFKVPGRVGDCAIAGGGAYADNEVGACGATGDGDTHLRFLPCFQVVESMRHGMTPAAAAQDAIRRIAVRVPSYVGALFAIDSKGNHAGAAHGFANFTYAFQDPSTHTVQVVSVKPLVSLSVERSANSNE